MGEDNFPSVFFEGPLEVFGSFQLNFQPIFGSSFGHLGNVLHPIDLDIWLEQPALTMKTAKVSHRKVLTVIGDTIGSHVDQYIHPYIHALLSMKTGIATDQGNQLIHYLLKVSDSALALCQRLLEKR